MMDFRTLASILLWELGCCYQYEVEKEEIQAVYNEYKYDLTDAEKDDLLKKVDELIGKLTV